MNILTVMNFENPWDCTYRSSVNEHTSDSENPSFSYAPIEFSSTFVSELAVLILSLLEVPK